MFCNTKENVFTQIDTHIYSHPPCLLLTRQLELCLLIQEGVAVCSQGRRCVLWLGAANALLISLASFFPLQFEFRAKRISRNRLAIPALEADRFAAAWETLNRSWNSPQLSWLVFALPHICRPTLASSENLDGLDPIFFPPQLLQTYFYYAHFCASNFCHLWQTGGWNQAVILCTWAKLSLLPLLSHTETLEWHWRPVQRTNWGTFWQPLMLSLGPLQHGLISLALKLHQDAHTTHKKE